MKIRNLHLIWIPAILILLVLSSCKNSGSGRIGPDPIGRIQTPDATIQNLWPDEDGSQWIYELAIGGSRAIEFPIFETPEEVPEQPSFEEIIAMLPDARLIGPDVIEGMYEVEIDGMGRTDSGARGKRMLSELMLAGPSPVVPKPTWALEDATRLLTGKRSTSSSAKGEEFERITPILFISDGIWTKTSEYIGYYNDLDQDLRFRLAVADLSIGNEWSIQTVPSIADYVWLHARILDSVNVDTPMGEFLSIVRILYVFDTGVQQMRDPFGSTHTYFRPLIYAIVDYAPTYGPVHFREMRTTVGKDEHGIPVVSPTEYELEGVLLSFKTEWGGLGN
jgi:hypothetical protein